MRKIQSEISEGPESSCAKARERYIDLLSAGGNDHPMALLKRAGVDLSEPSTILAVVDQLNGVVSRLEELV